VAGKTFLPFRFKPFKRKRLGTAGVGIDKHYRIMLRYLRRVFNRQLVVGIHRYPFRRGLLDGFRRRGAQPVVFPGRITEPKY
jgi:hypothetical protein